MDVCSPKFAKTFIANPSLLILRNDTFLCYCLPTPDYRLKSEYLKYGASRMFRFHCDRLLRPGKSDRGEMYPPIPRRNDIRPRPRSFTFSGVRWNLPRRSSWACVVSTRTSRPSSIGVAFVAAVHNYSRRDYLPTKEVVRAAASRGVARFDESAGLFVESVANRDQDTGTWRDQRCSIEGFCW